MVCSDSAENCPKCKHNLAALKIAIGLTGQARTPARARERVAVPSEAAPLTKPAPAISSPVAPLADPNWTPPKVVANAEITSAMASDFKLLFDDAAKELPSYDEEILLGAEQLLLVHNRDDIRVIFDLADEAFGVPEVERLLEQGIDSSEQIRVESRNLASALKSAQREMDAPFTLAAMSRARAKQGDIESELFKKTRRVVPAPYERVLLSGVFDQAVVLALSLVLMVLLWPELGADWGTSLQGSSFGLVTSLILIVLLFENLYWLISFLVFGRTLGERISGIIVVNAQRGGAPGRSSLVIRALFGPITRLLGIFGASLGQKVNLWSSGTVLTRKRRLGRAT